MTNTDGRRKKKHKISVRKFSYGKVTTNGGGSADIAHVGVKKAHHSAQRWKTQTAIRTTTTHDGGGSTLERKLNVCVFRIKQYHWIRKSILNGYDLPA